MEGDFNLKVQLNSIFWDLGYYTRLELKLAGYSPQKSAPYELTDLDVLGIRVNPDLTFDYLLGDCTSSKRVTRSPIQRVFWLRGVMHFFGANKGYLCLSTKSPLPEVQRISASDLGVTILNFQNLQNLGKRTSRHSPDLLISSPDSWQYYEGNLTTLPAGMDHVLEFRKYKYWLTPPHDRIHALISLLSTHKAHFKNPTKFLAALSLDLLSLLSLSVLQMSSYALRVNPETPEPTLRSYLFGGYSEMKRREGIVDNIKKLVDTMTPQQELFPSKEGLKSLQLDPDYLPRLFDTAFRLLNKPFDAAQIPRYIECTLFEKTLYAGKNDKGLKFIDGAFSDITRKLSRDLAKLLSDAAGVPPAMFADL